MAQLRLRSPDRRGADAGGGPTKAERLDPPDARSHESRPDAAGDAGRSRATLATLPWLKRFDIIPTGERRSNSGRAELSASGLARVDSPPDSMGPPL
jgi:hypothetical protein